MEMLVLAIAGALSGLIAGLVGLAGGIVVVPALTWLYGNSVLHDAIVVSWFAVLFNSIGAALKQYRIRSPEERRAIVSGARTFVLGAVIITPLVALTLSGARSLITPVMVAVLQLCLAAVMLWPIREVSGESGSRHGGLDFLFGGLIGGISVVIGVGGGTYTIAYFVYVARRKFQDAIATANMTGLIIGALSVAGYLLSLLMDHAEATDPAQPSPIDAVGKVVLIVSGTIFSSVGVRLSRKLPVKTLRKILVFALMVSATRLLMS